MNSLNRFIKLIARGLTLIFKPVAPHPVISCGNINALLLHLCDFDYELHMWVLCWLAYPLRNPGAKMSTCLLVNGGQGTGKTMFFAHVVAEIYGGAGRMIGTKQLRPNALQWTDGAQFVVVDGHYSDESALHLKHLVSDSAVYAVAANKRAATLKPNHMNFAFLTGDLDFLPVEATNRRFVAIEAPPPRQRLFYEAAQYEINNGGVEAFREYLMRGVDMADFTATTPPPLARQKEVAA
jgi:hypothetical protein